MSQRARLRLAQSDERIRHHRDRGASALGDFYTVVDTPRRAGASVAGAGDHQVALRGEFVDRPRAIDAVGDQLAQVEFGAGRLLDQFGEGRVFLQRFEGVAVFIAADRAQAREAMAKRNGPIEVDAPAEGSEVVL